MLDAITPRYSARLYELRREGRLRYEYKEGYYGLTWMEGDPGEPPVDSRVKPNLFPQGRDALLQAFNDLPDTEWKAVLGRSMNIKGFLLKRLPDLLERIERGESQP